jgi:hypothetical protein
MIRSKTEICDIVCKKVICRDSICNKTGYVCCMECKVHHKDEPECYINSKYGGLTNGYFKFIIWYRKYQSEKEIK